MIKQQDISVSDGIIWSTDAFWDALSFHPNIQKWLNPGDRYPAEIVYKPENIGRQKIHVPYTITVQGRTFKRVR